MYKCALSRLTLSVDSSGKIICFLPLSGNLKRIVAEGEESTSFNNMNELQ